MSEVSNGKKTNKSTLLLLALAFLLPVGLAKLALENDWFNRASTNKGELLEPSFSIQPLLADQEPKWRLMYRLPQQCNVQCDNALYSIKQVHQALGKHMGRATTLVIASDDSDQDTLATLSDDSTINLLKVQQQNVNQVFKDAPADGIFLVDTLGNVILRYPLQQEKQQAVLKSRDVLADLRKLLKLSRIG